MAAANALPRLRKEFERIVKEPVPNIEAAPLESNILEWHYVIVGPTGTPYEGGVYHGKLVFPSEYPYKPPSIFMITPNGRFKPNERLCLSMSDFHPETWNPLWSVSSILSGLLSFMLESASTYGSIETTDVAKRNFARASLSYNCKDKIFNTLFPHYREFLEELRTGAAAAVEDTKLDNATANSEVRQRTAAKTRQRPLEVLRTNPSARSIALAGAKESAVPLSGSTAASGPLQAGHDGQAQPGPQLRRPLTNAELQDRLAVVIVVVTILFALSYLYT